MHSETVEKSAQSHRPMTKQEKKVIWASSLGTVFEWYDFGLYGTLAVVLGQHFFSAFDPAIRNVFVLLAFAAGFLVRPFGAALFGRIGDLSGRKYTFLITIILMGLATFLVGVLPTYGSIGIAAPICLIVLRMIQGLAVGGEYGGAAIYVAEHAPSDRRGYYTSWIQTTANIGVLMTLTIVVGIRMYLGEQAFLDYGWRIPFLLSIILLVISVWVRLQMQESPAFLKMKAEGKQSKAPIKEALGQWRNLKMILIALFGLIAGQAVVNYTGQFYALFFMQGVLKIDLFTSTVMIAWAIFFGTAGFIFFGSLSDKVGRKPVILLGCFIAAVTYFPIYSSLTKLGSPNLDKALETVVTELRVDKNGCGSVFDPVGIRTFTSDCDIARVSLARAAVKYTLIERDPGTPTELTIGGSQVRIVPSISENIAAISKAAQKAGYPGPNDPSIFKADSIFAPFQSLRGFMIMGLLLILTLYMAAVYTPIAAALVEFFPTRIRYTALSIPYHIGNGWFGGFVPPTAFAMVASTGDIYFGLWYPITVACLTVLIGTLFVPETKGREI